MRAAIVVTALVCAGVVDGRAGDTPGREPLGLLERPGELASAVRTRFGGDVRVLRLSLHPERADIEVQDPAAPLHVDRYAYEDGALGPPEPVPAGRNLRRLNAQLFRWAEVDLAVLPGLLADAVTRTETEDGRVTHVLVERSDRGGEYESWGRPLIRVFVEGPRGGGYVEYGLDGKKKRVQRW